MVQRLSGAGEWRRTQWLPPPGEHDLLMVAVQNCEYSPPQRSEEWVSNARKVRPAAAARRVLLLAVV